MPIDKPPHIPMNAKNTKRDQSVLWGYAVDAWDRFGVWAMIAGGVLGILALFLSLVSAYVLYRVADVTQVQLASETKASAEHIAQLNNETARLHAKERLNALAAQSILTVAERIAIAQGLAAPGMMSEAARSLQIISKVSPFAGKQFDAIVMSSDVRLGTLLGSLKAALKGAGWIELDRSDDGTIHREQSGAGGAGLVKIHVDASKDSELLDAAEALASALNAEGIAATVIPEPETDTTKVNVIHILIVPKP